MMKPRSRLLGCAIVGVTVLFVLAGMFWLGTRVGGLETERGSANVRPGSPTGQPVPFFGMRPRRHGTEGSIVRVEADVMIVRSRFGVELTIHVAPDTLVERGEQRIKLGDVQAGERIIAIGSPRPDGSLDARFIRVFRPHSEEESHPR